MSTYPDEEGFAPTVALATRTTTDAVDADGARTRSGGAVGRARLSASDDDHN